MKLGNISANEVLVVGGVLAAAYVVYKLSGAVSNIGQSLSDAKNAVSDAVSGAVESVKQTASNVADSAKTTATDFAGGISNPFAWGWGPAGVLLGGTANVAQGAYERYAGNGNTAQVGATKYDASTQVGNAPSFTILSQDPVAAYSNPAANPIWASDGLTLTSPNGGLIFK